MCHIMSSCTEMGYASVLILPLNSQRTIHSFEYYLYELPANRLAPRKVSKAEKVNTHYNEDEVRSNDLKHILKSGTENIQKDVFLEKKKKQKLFTLDLTLKLRWYVCQFLYQQVASM